MRFPCMTLGEWACGWWMEVKWGMKVQVHGEYGSENGYGNEAGCCRECEGWGNEYGGWVWRMSRGTLTMRIKRTNWRWVKNRGYSQEQSTKYNKPFKYKTKKINRPQQPNKKIKEIWRMKNIRGNHSNQTWKYLPQLGVLCCNSLLRLG